MDKNDENKVTQVMIDQDAQINADIYKIIMSLNKNDIKYQELKDILTKKLIETGRYKIKDIEERVEELKKYTETFRKKIEEEQRQKDKKRIEETIYISKAGKVIKAYEGQETYMALTPENNESFEKKKSIIELVMDYIKGKNKTDGERVQKIEETDYKGTLQERITVQANQLKIQESSKPLKNKDEKGIIKE